MYGVHLHKSGQPKRTEILIEPVCKNGAVCDLCFMTFPGFESDFPFQINIPGTKNAIIKIGVHRADGHIQFRMIGQDMIGGLSLLNERGYNSVFLVKLLPGQVDAGPGIMKPFPVLSVRKTWIVNVFVGNGTVIDFFVTTITDIRSFFQSAAEFFVEVFTGLIAGGTGGAFDAAQNDFSAGIGLATVITMDTEVLGIIKGAFMIPVREPVGFHFFRDRGRVLAKKPGDILKGSAFIQFIFNIDTVVKSKVFLITWDIFTHRIPPSTAVRRRDNYNISI